MNRFTKTANLKTISWYLKSTDIIYMLRTGLEGQNNVSIKQKDAFLFYCLFVSP